MAERHRTGRTILHVDMDAFYVSVELRRHPELVGRPVVVGGTGDRGVVAAASYEARRHGVHSALPSVVARRRCPDAVFLPGDHAHYAEVSRQVRAILDRYTPMIEPLALDEAFLDVTGSIRLFGEGVVIADRIRREVADELQLGCSVGVAANKFLAKMASVAAKPRALPDRIEPGPGVVEVRPGDEVRFLHPLPVDRLWGVGPKTLERLQRIGIRTIGDLSTMEERIVVGALGPTQGRHLRALASGSDDRPVVVDRDPKSVGHEETYARDIVDPDALGRELVRLADAVSARLRRNGLAARTLVLKVRFAGFRTITRSVTLPSSVDTAPEIVSVLRPVLSGIDISSGVRLLGVSGSNFAPRSEQLELFTAPGRTQASPASESATRSAAAIDEIRDRFGASAIAPASSISSRRVRVVRDGAQQWGPDRETDAPR